ncbi:hypothetical protein JCM11491_006411 [Sporobolomyces phaffii]
MSLTVAELRAALAALSLDSRGNKHALKLRLAKHSRAASSPSPSPTPTPTPPRARVRPAGQHFDSYLVFDVEATCESIPGNPKLAFSYPNEIIEWPVILLQWRERPPDSSTPTSTSISTFELVVVDEFHSFVRPNWNPELSEFCTDLTGISQEQVDEAPRFQKLLRRFEKDFIAKHALFTKENETVWVTDGPWDLRDFVAKTCYLSKVPRPDWLAGEIVDLKLSASHFFTNLKKKQQPERPPQASPSPSPPPPSASLSPTVPVTTPPPDVLPVTAEPSLLSPRSSSALDYLPNSSLTSPPDLSITSLLSALTLAPFIGRPHSGLSDARNIARIVIDLASSRGVELTANRVVPDGGKGGKERRWGWMGRGGEVKWESHKRYETRRYERELAEGKKH